MSAANTIQVCDLPTGTLRLETFLQNRWVVVAAAGELCAADAFLFEGVIATALRRGRGSVVIDLSAVSHLDVLAYAVLVKTRAHMRTSAGQQLRLVPSREVASSFEAQQPTRWHLFRTVEHATQENAPGGILFAQAIAP